MTTSPSHSESSARETCYLRETRQTVDQLGLQSSREGQDQESPRAELVQVDPESHVPAPDLVARPLWQRVTLSVGGLLLLAIGILGWALPIIPGLPLVIASLPMLFSFHPRAEAWARRRSRLVARYFFKGSAGQPKNEPDSVDKFFKQEGDR